MLGSAGETIEALRGVRVLFVFHSFKDDDDTLAFIKNVRHLGVVPPLNLLYVSAWLRRHGVETEVLDCNGMNLGLDAALARARGLRFDVLCFTVTNLDFLFAIDWIRAFKREFGKPILVGGPAVENYPAEIAAHPEIDVAFHSPAEACVAEWLGAFVRGGAASDVPGTALRHEGTVRVNPPAPLPRGFVRPLPDRARVETRRYRSILAKGAPFTAGMASFGCPFGCEFCQIRRTQFFARTAEDLVREMEVCERELGIEEIDYFDSGMTVPRGRVFELAELYRRKRLRIRWSARARVDQVDRELLRAMRSTNCSWIGFGLESGDEGVQANIRKDQGGQARILEMLRLTKDEGLGTTGFFVLGLPGESAETLDRTLAFIERAPLDFVQLSPYWPIPRTPIYERLVASTGVDVWRDAIVHGTRRSNMALGDTAFSVQEMHRATARLYREFYFRPRQLLAMLGNAASLAQLRSFAGAGLDVLRGATLGRRRLRIFARSE